METFSIVQNWWQFVLLFVIAYACGCVNFARIIARAKKVDITKMGSGNPGTMNMTRSLGRKAGAATFFCDIFKAVIPMLFAYFLFRDYVFEGTNFIVSDFTRYLCGVAVVLGHIYPAPMKFKGGKGIASTFGVFCVGLTSENPWFFFIWLGIMTIILILMITTELGALASIIGVALFAVAQEIIFMFRYAEVALNPYLVCAFVLVFAIILLDWWAHRGNILRLFSGEERRTAFVKKKNKKA